MKFINQNKSLFYGFFAVLCLSIIILIVLGTKKIEIISSSKIKVDKSSVPSFIIPNDDVYKFKVGGTLNFRIDEQIFKATISKIAYDSEQDCFSIIIDSPNKYFIPDSTISVQIIRGSQTILSSLMSV